MQGFLDHLETSSGGVLFHKKAWTPRFFSLNDAFHCLEFFTDASMQSRKGRIELQGAHIASADELGELLLTQKSSSHGMSPTKLTSKIAIENSRRFVFRIATPASTTTSTTTGNLDTKSSDVVVHYLCAEVANMDESENGGPPTAAGAVDAASSRQQMDQWLRVLRDTAARASTRTSTTSAIAPVDLRELNAKISLYMDQLHVSAHVTARNEDASGKGQYELTVQAWTLQRELLETSSDSNSESEDETHDTKEWQVVEYSCAWKISKTSAQFQEFDAQLRQFFGSELRDLKLPTFSGVRAFLKQNGDHQESDRRLHLYNEYLAILLCLPVFSVFASDASAMLDTFLSISPHLKTLKKVEKANGQNLKLRNKHIVPWQERERFEQVYAVYVALMEAKEAEREQKQKKRMIRMKKEKERKVKKEKEESKRHHHHHRHHRERESSSDAGVDVGGVELQEPEPVVVTVEVDAMAAVQVDSVHDRIARIGHKLLVEAFQATDKQ